MIKILVCGANGRMGKEAVIAIENDPQVVLAGVCLREHNLAEQIKLHSPDVVLDLSIPEVVFENCVTIIEHDIHPVIGTSGLTIPQIETLQKRAEGKQLGGIIAPNFSLGVMLMIKMAALAARYLPHAEIVELHHDKKLDAPSGTAARTAQVIAQNRQVTITVPGPHNAARGIVQDNVPIHSVRLPGLLAHQKIIFGGTFESLEIRQDSFDRKSFMPGVILACKKVRELKHLVYGLENLV